MVFNEYNDILDYGNIYFLDEENLFQIMLEEDQQSSGGGTPSGLSSSDNTASSEEKKEANQQGNNNQNIEATKKSGLGLLKWMKLQGQKFGQFANEQMEKLNSRKRELKEKVDSMPIDYNGDEEVEMPKQAPDPAPRMERAGDDPGKMEAAAKKFEEDTKKWREKQSSKMKTVVKGGAMILGGKWLLKQIFKTSGEVEFNLKEGKFYASMGMGKAQQAAGGNSFALAIGTVIRNVFLAILVLIGGLFKVLKEYLSALGRIIGIVFKTVGQAGSTLVTGKMPSKA